MITRRAHDRGHNVISWLDSYHTFSFGHYYDPKWTHFHKLLVINDDTIAPSMGFGTHPHRDMEIITYVTHGQLKHRDSMGSLGLITPGEIQVMSAGTGVTHSEFNDLSDTSTHLFQIWIMPKEKNLKPRYDQKRVFNTDDTNFLKLIASSHAQDGTIMQLNADAQIWAARYDHGARVTFRPELYSHYWIQMVKGSLSVNGIHCTVGDGIGIENKGTAEIEIHGNGAEFLIFEVDTFTGD